MRAAVCQFLLLHPKDIVNVRALPASWRSDPRYVYVGRPSCYGNPFRLSQYSRGEAIARFEIYARRNKYLIDKLHLLDGKFLVCSCAPLYCHAFVLKKLMLEKKLKANM